MSPVEILPNLRVPRETLTKLELYQSELTKWQSAINLISSTTINDIWERHICDSLQLIPYIKNKDSVIVDLGSGAGLPGIVLAICGHTNVHLIESDQRKIVFLREIARKAQVLIHLHNSRIEACLPVSADIIVARACSSLSTLLMYADLHGKEKSHCLFHKGKNYSTELEKAFECWQFDYEIYPSQIDAESVIIKLCNITERL